MARGFLSGALWGGAISILVGGVASVVAPLPPRPVTPVVGDTDPGAVVAPETVADAGQAPATLPATAEAPVPSAPGGLSTDPPAAETLPDLEAAPTTRPTVPVSDRVTAPDAPATTPDTGAVALSTEEPVIPNPQALAPMLPQAVDGVAIDTDPAAPPKPAQDTDAVTAEDPQGVPQAETETALAETAPETPAADAGTDATAPASDADESSGPASEPAAATADADTPAPTQSAGTADAPEPEAPSVAERLPTAPADTPQADDETQQVAALTPTPRPQIGTPAISLTDREGSVAIRRPGVAATSPADALPRVTPDQTGTDADPADTRPITRFARGFSNEDGKPLMSILLIDDGTSPTSGADGIAALSSFPYVLSFAVDSSLPDAAERMDLYRAEGFEVVAQVDLPEGAEPVDVETTLAATLAQMDKVVGVLEGSGQGLQASRTAADQVTAILAQTGHGLITQNKGLNTMPKLARKQGVPAAPVFRDFDSKGQKATVIRRFLDQAAFKAGQEGAVIMLGRLRPDTISALLLWGLQDRAGKVALAPISAVLKEDR